MHLTLNEEDGRVLRDILQSYLPELRRESARTELASRDLRHELAVRETLCERLLDELSRLTAQRVGASA